MDDLLYYVGLGVFIISGMGFVTSVIYASIALFDLYKIRKDKWL